MKLKSVQIKNFRCFDSLSIDFDEQLTVLVAENGQGKSAVLDAIRVGLWSFVGGFDLARNPASYAENNISVDDVRMEFTKHNGAIRRNQGLRYDEMKRQLPCEITLQGSFDINLKDNEKNIKEHSWTRFRDTEAKGTKTKRKKTALLVKALAEVVQTQVRDPDGPDINLPVIAYYGTGRLWRKNRLTEKKKKQDASFYMRLFGYRDCLDPSSSYKDFADWFTWIFECYREYRDEQSEKGLSSERDSVWSNTIQVVQQVTGSILHEAGWHTLEYSVSREKSLVLKHNEYGTLKVEQLSDGIRNVLGMVGDIAYRCLKLNPHLGLNAAKEARGVVMIDEVDMHLHPSWQQTILGGLTKAFPKIQFIVTTHSPQVLTTVQAKCIRLLTANGVQTPEINPYGEESKVALEDIMGTDSRPPSDEADLLKNYLQHINQGDIDSPEVTQWRQTLEQVFGSEYSKLKLADMVISKWKVKRGMA